MKASLDTNALIHFYRAELQNFLFEIFYEGVIIYEQIYYVELHNHGKDVFPQVEDDIKSEKIELYSDSTLREQCVYSISIAMLMKQKFCISLEIWVRCMPFLWRKPWVHILW